MATTSIGFDIFAKDRASGVFAKLGAGADDVRVKFGKTGAAFDKVGQAAGKALAGGLVIAGAAAVKLGQAAAEDEAAASKLAQTLHTAAGATDEQIASTEAWISAQGRALGVTDDELRPAIGRLAAATGDLGEAQRLTALAMDISAGSGKSLEQVTEALQKGVNGSVGGLSRLGVATKNADGSTKSLNEITRDLAGTYEGAAAKAADTTAGKQKRLQVALGELGEEIGARVLPAMVKLSEIGLKMATWVGENQRLVGVLVVAVAGFAAVLWTISAAMRAWLILQAAWGAATKVATAIQWAFNAAIAANPVGLIVVAIAALVVGLVIAYKKSETFRDIVKAALDKVKAAGQSVADFFTKKVPAAFDKVKDAAGKALGWVKANWPKILAILTGPIGLAVLVIAKNWDKIKAGGAKLLDWFKGLPGKIKGFFSGLGGIISAPFEAAFAQIKSWWNATVGGFGFSVPDWVPKVGGNEFRIPEMAKGGIVTRPTLALIGEAGAEAVIPLTGARGRGFGGGPQQPVIVQLVLPNGKVIEQILIEHSRTTGRPLQVRTLGATA